VPMHHMTTDIQLYWQSKTTKYHLQHSNKFIKTKENDETNNWEN